MQLCYTTAWGHERSTDQKSLWTGVTQQSLISVQNIIRAKYVSHYFSSYGVYWIIFSENLFSVILNLCPLGQERRKGMKCIFCLFEWDKAGYFFITYLSTMRVAFWNVNCFISESSSFLLSALKTSWIFALKQILSAKGSLWTEGEYGSTVNRCPNLCTSQNTDFGGNMLCFCLIFCCKTLQQRSSVSDALWRLLHSLKFLWIFLFFWNKADQSTLSSSWLLSFLYLSSFSPLVLDDAPWKTPS